MSKCLICGIESDSYLCYNCICTCDIEKLCIEISVYKLESMENELWEHIAAGMKENGVSFKDTVFEIAKNIPSPHKENLFI